MKFFEYGDEEVGTKEVVCAIANMVIGFGILTLPRSITLATNSIDGWITIMIGGMIALSAAYIVAKLVSRFPKQNLFVMMSSITNIPLAYIVTLIFTIYYINFVGYNIRGVSNLVKIYMFDRTPPEVIILVFLLVLIYAVSGSSNVLLRLNLMFLPIVLIIMAILLLTGVSFFELRNVKPFFITDWSDIWKGSYESLMAFLGFEIILFYNSYFNQPKQIVKAVVLGMSIPLFLYVFVFVSVVGVFGIEVTSNVIYPTIELSKQVEIPGEIFERFDSIFLTVWIMTLFNTAAMAYDVSILALNSVFKKIKKITLVIIAAPFIYLIAMAPRNVVEITNFGRWIDFVGILLGMLLPLVIFIIAKIRGVKANE